MSLSRTISSFYHSEGNKPKPPYGHRQRTFWAAAVTAVSLSALTSCGLDSPAAGFLSSPASFKGIVAADSAQAALIGKEILKYGGNAFDAATAMAFTMTVTLPSRAGLGSYGVCQTFNPKSKERQIISFAYNGENKKYALPAMPRAMLAVHAKGGNLRWEDVVLPAEKIAKTGFAVSKQLAEDGATYYNGQYQDKNGNVLKEDDFTTATDLAASLSLLRTKAVNGLYNSNGAQRFVEAANYSGVEFSLEEMRDFIPQWTTADAVKDGNDTIYVMSSALSSENPATLWESSKAASENKLPTKSKTDKKVYGAGLAVADAQGNAVACAFSMGGLFGTGKEVKGTGIILAEPMLLPTDELATVSIVNDNIDEFRYIGYAVGANANSKLVQDAITLKKEAEGAGKEDGDGKEDAKETPSYNGGAIYCDNGLPLNYKTCVFAYSSNKTAYGINVRN